MRIGMALSGGGAKGFAHLGILKALEEMGVTINEFSGTSAGAIAGAFYCYGHKPDQILEIITSTGFLKSVRPAWSWTGLLSMDGFKEVMHQYLPENSFESLKYPLTVAATEIRLGKISYFNSGELISRVIASSTIPALFNPMTLDGHVYVDGGIMDNLPVRPLVGKCDFIIGSHTSPVQERFEINNVKEVTERSLLIAIGVTSSFSKAQCNLIIEPPELAKFSTLDLSKGKEIFEIGYNFTKENFKEIDFQLNQQARA
ncbi:MAG: patatin-like phospholipase family protein [Cyclobacteriaceae bacterium]